MGTKKCIVSIVGAGAQHARPCGSRSAPGSMTSIDPYMQKRMLASVETKEKPLAERIGKGLSGARYRTRTCDLLHVKQMLYQLS